MNSNLFLSFLNNNDMKKFLVSVLSFVYAVCFLSAEEYHVSKTGSDLNPGTKDAPFLTISKAASVARSGDVVTVHEGIYREWVNPVNGGADVRSRIVYQAAEGEEVWIKGSEQITNWTREKKTDIWKVTLPNSWFGDFNPYSDILGGDWLYVTQPYITLGEVYLNNKSLFQTGSLNHSHKSSETEQSPPAATRVTISGCLCMSGAMSIITGLRPINMKTALSSEGISRCLKSFTDRMPL